ncbi:MAG: hypothetical protein ACQGVC_07860 [Myxococcota bacterium]
MRRAGRLRQLLVAGLLIPIGCASLPPGVGLGKGTPAPERVDARVWVDLIEIDDERATRQTSEALTLQLSRYIEERRYFRDVRVAPGNAKPEDLVLSIELDRYFAQRSVHPAYFPGAFLTLTLWIWFGGPIFTDSAEFTGVAEIRSPSGELLASGKAELSDRHSVSFWSPNYAIPSATEERTSFFRELLDDAVSNLQKGIP